MRFILPTTVGSFLVLVLAGRTAWSDDPPEVPPEATATERSVFDMPIVTAKHTRLQQASMLLIQNGNYDQAERFLEQALELFPDHPIDLYNLACVRARQGKQDDALNVLALAVANGFNGVKQLQEDPDLASIREASRFAEIVEQARQAEPPKREQKITPGSVLDGKATVTEANTAWDGQNGIFRTFFLPPNRETVPDKVGGRGSVAELLAEWYAEETAAGNVGDFYDNHDNDHSKLSSRSFPQVVPIRYSEAAKRRNLHTGLQQHFFFNTVTFGNSSTAVTGGKVWRSQTRLAYTQPRGPAILHAQYRSNQLYIYPEHRDHDPGHNGKDGGYGDLYPANTPYVITSQGSSGSDRPFLEAVAQTLAAFQPQTKKLLLQRGALMPTIQMIFRRCNQPVQSDADYLTDKAHPSVFEGDKLDVMKMITLAHSINPDATPPLVHLRAIEEDEAVLGQDYFDVAQRERLFDTPAAIARIYRTLKSSRRMVVSAVESSDLNERELTFYWRVLRGNSDEITITPLNSNGSKVELQIPYHQRQPIHADSKMASNRVDIGVFVHNGDYFSAPGFVTFFFLDNEQRVYREDGQIKSVAYTSRAHGGNYVDPFLDVPKQWRDEYHYDANNQLTFWSRHRGDAVEWFTADGKLVTEWDNQRRPLETVQVQYVAQGKDNQFPHLEQKTTDQRFSISYSSADDQAGNMVPKATSD